MYTANKSSYTTYTNLASLASISFLKIENISTFNINGNYSINGTADRESMEDHSVIRVETQSEHSIVTSETAYPQDPMMLTLKYWDACIDSDATFSLLSEKIFMKIHNVCDEVLEADDVELRGTSGQRIKLRGCSRVPFWIEGMCYDYPVLIGDLAGVDMLLSMDWPITVQGHLDFYKMTVRLGPMQELNPRTSRRAREPPTNDMGFVHVREACMLIAWHTTHIICITRGEWSSPYDAVFDLEHNTEGRSGHNDMYSESRQKRSIFPRDCQSYHTRLRTWERDSAGTIV